MKQTEPETLGEILQKFISNRSLRQGQVEGQAKEVWREVVGDYVSEMCEDVFLREGKLYIKAQSSAIRSEIHIRRRYYVDRLNAILGRGAVRSIVLR